MKRVCCVCFFLLLVWPLSPAGQAQYETGLPQLKKDLSDIICGLLSCFERNHERHFLETAFFFAEIRTHPVFDLAWGRRPYHVAAERRILETSFRYRCRFDRDGCPPQGSEQNLCRLALAYIRTNDGEQVPARKVPMQLSEKFSIGRLQAGLSARQMLLKYVLLEDRMLVFFIGADSAGYEFLSAATPQAVLMINRLSDPLKDFSSGKVDYLRIHFDLELAYRLFNIFLKKVVGRFPDCEELFIIPDQELFKIPFEALVMGFNKNCQQDDILFSEYQAADYVIQKYVISYYLSFADFLRHFEGRKDHRYTLAAFGQPLVAKPPTGNAGVNGASAGSIREIPSTRQEILDLGKMFADSRRCIFLGADFNQANFTRFAPLAKLIHLATHFFNDGDDPSRSAFLFSSAGPSPSWYDARQILKFRLRAELVILSACETSETNLLGFKSLSGMTAAFRESGVRDLIASFWPVDEFSSLIVPHFYNEFLKSNGSASALRNAKLALFNKTVPFQGNVRLSLKHPFLWANFVLIHFFR